ncbi:MAG TPA: N-acetylmuramic acid 6-phosphate etherase [Verrucomicrobiota bacterium]|nr:N-acetylmuramic acid 6-phosphate etherase [Verrucomicrobiota bacterium]HRR65160.1 N-acetylmuramic acid 6-phosphate etherase [Candidatus Paceibacterota bacterium]MDI9372459.1 N-acetylmuramic acid 6-phosphate etherase [Verrucomicrobiota bacterium]NLH84942.1 N-acetylmuramic acid 6-phosphate etherase [Verrucomicrobiota bacterium]HNR70603.1 N-acetylmuramic acid 6-phosphate etherase [Verrucomicrobiota bacterium]
MNSAAMMRHSHSRDERYLSQAGGSGRAARKTAPPAAARADAAPRRLQVFVFSEPERAGGYGRNWDGRAVGIGGRGAVLGDRGSGYDLGVRALQAVAAAYDQRGVWPSLGRRLLRALQLNEPGDLMDWARTAEREEIARLAAEVFAARSRRDKLAADILADAAGQLARNAAACARRLARPGVRIQFVPAGSVFRAHPSFAAQVGRAVRKLWPRALVASQVLESVPDAAAPVKRERSSGARGAQNAVRGEGNKKTRPEAGPERVRSRRPSPTEQRNPRSRRLDTLSLERAIRLMLAEEGRVPGKLQAEHRRMARLIQAVVRAFRRGGRLFYVGAGTSGRLGVLDASECPPTFGAPPGQVQGIIAGGRPALWQSVEGAEDQAEAGARALAYRGLGRRDVVVGLAASGTTPFVWGALDAARRRGATTALICFNPFLRIPRARRPDVVIAPNLGPEVLTGSTRLKAGTATKQLLNILTTLAMVRLGKVRSNLMIDLHPANAKLRGRAVRIVRELTGADAAGAEAALRRAGWNIRKAIALPGAKPRTGVWGTCPPSTRP